MRGWWRSLRRSGSAAPIASAAAQPGSCFRRFWPAICGAAGRWSSRRRWAPPIPSAPATPKQTLRRWAGRLASSAVVLVAVLAQAATSPVARLVRKVRHNERRLDLVSAYAALFEVQPGRRLCALAGLLHRMAPGVRLM